VAQQPTDGTGAAGTPAPTPTIKASDVPAVTAADHIQAGTDKAKATMVVYTDLECPFCKRFDPTVAQLIKDYGDKLRVVFRHYPLSFHASAQKASEASECAFKQGGDTAFFKYVEAYFAKTDSSGTGVKEDGMIELAGTLGLNKDSFKQCLTSGEMEKKVKDLAAGGDAASTKANAGGQAGLGTPSTFVMAADGRAELVAGAYPIEQFKTILDKYVK
jgi:protein-disulfide isomerase